MNYCSQCGQPVTLKIPVDDNRERFVCDHCGYVHYQNPNNVCGAILTRGDEVLLCKRAIEPRYISQVYLMFHGELISDISAGQESLEVGMFTRQQIPWDELAFPVVTHSLELFYEHGTERVHHAWFSRGPNREVELHSID